MEIFVRKKWLAKSVIAGDEGSIITTVDKYLNQERNGRIEY